MHDRPRVRVEGLVSETVDDELVIYDERSQMAHCLSADASVIWEHCDGHRSAQELAASLELDVATVERAVEELDRSGLLEQSPAEAQGLSRREAAKRFAKIIGAAFAAPMIYSVAIGPAAAAASPATCDRIRCAATRGSCAEARNAATTDCTDSAACQTSSTCQNVGNACTAVGFARFNFTGTCSF